MKKENSLYRGERLRSNFKNLAAIALLAISTTFVQSCADDEEVINESELSVEDTTYNKVLDICDLGAKQNDGKSLTVDCLIDLKGQTVALDQQTEIDYQGGSFINGTVSVNTNVVDSRILGSDVKVEGAKSVSNGIFEFIPSHWDIVEGRTSDANALKNRDRLEEAIQLADELGANTFQIDELDAYFLVSEATESNNFYSSRESINVPDGMTLQMSDDTHLRVQPNSSPKYALLAVRDVSYSKIFGGNLYGDRDEHNYSSGGTHEWGFLIEVHGADNIKIDGVTLKNATGDGIKIHSLNFTFEDNYIPSNNITVSNCILDSNRRNNMSITDGYRMFIENNTFIKAGIDTNKSKGTKPKFQLDIEPHRKRDTDGDLIEYERVNDIIVRNNIEKETGGGGFVAFTGKRIVFENNSMEKGISWQFASQVSIVNNKFKANPNGNIKSAVVGGRSDNINASYGNVVSGNQIEGYESGITLYGKENKVYANKIFQCEQGIFLRHVKDSKIYSNTIESTVEDSKGIFAHITTIDNVSIFNHKVNVHSDPYKFIRVNINSADRDNRFSVYNNTFTSTRRSNIENTCGMKFKGNKLTSSMRVTNSQDLIIDDNDMTTTSSSGYDLRGVNKDISIINNTIDVKDASYSRCIKVASTTSSGEVSLSNNECDQ